MMNEPTTTEVNTCTFRTKDLNQAAFIWCQEGADLVRLDGSGREKRTIIFIFSLAIDEVELGKLIIDYANKKTRVEPQEFCNKQSNLRDLLHGSLAKVTSERKVT